MIAVDTNILVHAFRRSSPHHEAARSALTRLAASPRAWAVPWPCVHEFLAVVTNPRSPAGGGPVDAAIGAVQVLADDPMVLLLAETSEHATVLGSLLVGGQVLGPRVHDAQIAAICIAHGVDELWTADRDFSYFPDLHTRNPLVG